MRIKLKYSANALMAIVPAHQAVNIDALNALASGSAAYLSRCDYEDHGKYQWFLYRENQNDSFPSNLRSADIVKTAILLNCILRLSASMEQQALFWGNIVWNPDYIYSCQEGYHFIYVPTTEQRVLDVKGVFRQILRKLPAHPELKQLRRQVRKAASRYEVVSVVREFVLRYQPNSMQDLESSDMNNEEGETTSLSAPAYREPQQNDPKNAEQYLFSFAFDDEELNTTTLPAQDEPEMGRQAELMSKRSEGKPIGRSVPDTRRIDTAGLLQSFVEDEAVTTFLSAERMIGNEDVGMTVPLAKHEQVAETAQSRARLLLVNNKTGNKTVVRGSRFLIGRDPSQVDFTVLNPTVGRKHAAITYEDGQYFISDLQSTNGTWLEGLKLLPDERVALTNRAMLMLGGESFTISLEEVSA